MDVNKRYTLEWVWDGYAKAFHSTSGEFVITGTCDGMVLLQGGSVMAEAGSMQQLVDKAEELVL